MSLGKKPKGLRPSSAAAANSAASGDIRKATVKAPASFKAGKTGARQPTRKASLPPKLTASFVMGVQRRPGKAAAAKARQHLRNQEGTYAIMLRDAATVDVATAASEAAKAAAAEAAGSAKAAAKAAAKANAVKASSVGAAADKGLSKQQIAKACGVVARMAAARKAMREAAEAATRARAAKERISVYTTAWKTMIDTAGTTGSWMGADGKRIVGDTLPVGHKLKQLLLTCGAQISEESCGLIFSQLGGTGSACDFESFMRLVCEYGANGSAAAASAEGKKKKQQQQQQPVRGSAAPSPLMSRSPLSKLTGSASKRKMGSPASPPKPIRWAEFREMLCDDSVIEGSGNSGGGGNSSGGSSSGGSSSGGGGGEGGESNSQPDADTFKAEAPTYVTDGEARLLFVRCGGSDEAGLLSRSDFDKAAASDLARRRRMGLEKVDAAALEC